MNRKTKEDLENIYGGMINESADKSMVAADNTGDLEGDVKKINKGTGPEASEVAKAADADERLSSGDVKKSTEGSKKCCTEKSSKFQSLFNQVVEEELEDSGIDSPSFDDETGDFPAAGPEEEEAMLDDELTEDEDTVTGICSKLSELFGKLGGLLDPESAVDDGELIDDEVGLEDDEMIAGEAVDSVPAPDSTAKLQGKGNMNTKAVKVVKKEVSGKSSGQEGGGKPKKAKDTSLSPKMSFKSNGSGAAVDGKDVSAFE